MIFLKNCCESPLKGVHRDEGAAPDPRFNLYEVVAVDFNVFEDAFEVLAFCILTVLEVKADLFLSPLHFHSEKKDVIKKN